MTIKLILTLGVNIIVIIAMFLAKLKRIGQRKFVYTKTSSVNLAKKLIRYHPKQFIWGTKSDLVCRDIDILKEMKDGAVSVSVAFNDNQTRRLFEAKTMDTEKRIEALLLLKEAGVRTGALVCPVIPYVTDVIPLIDQLEKYTDVIWIYGLSINDRSNQNWLNIQKILNTQFPDLIAQIEPIIFSKEHVYWKHLRETLASLKKNRLLNLNIHL